MKEQYRIVENNDVKMEFISEVYSGEICDTEVKVKANFTISGNEIDSFIENIKSIIEKYKI